MSEREVIGQAIVEFLADVTGLKAGLADAKKESGAAASQIGSLFTKFARFAFPVGVTAGLVVAGKAAIDTADHFNKLSQKSGVATEDLSALDYAAKLADLSTEGLATGLKFLNKNVDAAAQGSGPAADAFKKIGVSVKDADGKIRPTRELLYDLAGRFSTMPDGAKKTAMALQIFGKSGSEMIPFLNAGSAGLQQMADEAERYGLVISGDAAKASERFNDTLTKMQMRVTGLARSMTMPLMSTLAAVAQYLNGDFKTGLRSGEASFEGLGSIGRWLAGIFIRVSATLKQIGAEFGVVFGAMADIALASVGGVKSWGELWNQLKARQERARDEWTAIGDEAAAALQAISGETEKTAEPLDVLIEKLNRLKIAAKHGDTGAAKQIPEVERQVAAFRKLADGIEETAVANTDMTDSVRMQVLQLELQRAKLSGTAQEAENAARAIEELQVAAMKKGNVPQSDITAWLSASRSARAAEADKETASRWEQLAKQTEGIEKIYDDKRAKDYEALAEAKKKADQNWANFAYEMEMKRLRSSESILNRVAQLYKQNATTMEQVYGSSLMQVEGLFGEVMYDGITGKLNSVDDAFKDFFGSLVRQITNFLAQQAVIRLLEMMGSRGTLPQSNTSKFAGLVLQSAGVVGSANGNVLRGGFTPFARGGVVSSPTLGMIGEGAYNEAVIPLPDGRHVEAIVKDAPERVTNLRVVLTPDLLSAGRPSDDEIVAIVNRDILQNGELRKTIRTRT